ATDHAVSAALIAASASLKTPSPLRVFFLVQRRFTVRCFYKCAFHIKIENMIFARVEFYRSGADKSANRFRATRYILSMLW
ncbi:hypothetical protein, partial [Pantoea ananatis]|uniref:hypothetical protein n=1 Tax=Pantoea ananas TaxID=553 RepID=UPI001E621A5E